MRYQLLDTLVRAASRLLLAVALCCIGLPTTVQAQNQYGRNHVWNLPNYDRKPLHFGFSLGTTQHSFSLRHAPDFLRTDSIRLVHGAEVYRVEASASPGFHLGGLASFRLSNYFDLRTLFLLSFTQRSLLYSVRQFRVDERDEWIDQRIDIESIHTQFPLLIKFKAERINNYRPFLIAGINPAIDLASGSKDEEPYVHLQRFELFYEAGFGIDFYLYYFKFATELKYSFGVSNIIEQDASLYAGAVGGLYTHGLTLSFNFE